MSMIATYGAVTSTRRFLIGSAIVNDSVAGITDYGRFGDGCVDVQPKNRKSAAKKEG